MVSYQGQINAAKGHWLLGGVKVHHSSRFASRGDAEAWLKQCIETNRECGREIDYANVTELSMSPEINES